MATGLVHFHNLLRWIILILLLLSIFKSYTGFSQKRSFSSGDRKLWLFTMIACHITLLLGLYQVLAGRYGIFTVTLSGGESVMASKFYRFYWVEHPIMMIAAIVFVTMGNSMAKKQVDDSLKFRKAFRFFLIALILILAAIPWPGREEIGRSLIPGMTI